MSSVFPSYTSFDPAVPVVCVTPRTGRTIHRFYDTSPFSPSGRYIALTRFPVEDRLPTLGELAEVILVDLEQGEERVIAETAGWDLQVGAHVQWGTSDNELYYNDLELETWRPFGVKINPFTGQRQRLAGGIFMVSPDGRYAISHCLRRSVLVQPGYGVRVPSNAVPRNEHFSAEDGLYVTDTATGKRRLLISIYDIAKQGLSASDRRAFRKGVFYGFQAKWNLQGSRILFVLAWLPPGQSFLGRVSARLPWFRWKGFAKPPRQKRIVVTLKPDGSDVHVAVPASVWSRMGGHHPNWCPDGETILMNLGLDGRNQGMRFARVHYDGNELGPLVDGVRGSGHPTLHPSGRWLLSDAYLGEPVTAGDDTVPIRLIDVAERTERVLVRIKTKPPFSGQRHELRVDPHPAWDPRFLKVAFNACPHGTRRVYIVDLEGLVTNAGGT